MTDKYILLVEDNSDDVILTELAFQKCKVCSKLVAIKDGRAALDFLFCRGKYSERSIDEKPSLILLDLNLPIVSGKDVLNAIRTSKSFSNIPVIVLTSSSEEKDQTESYKLGANEYISKPTGFNQFIRVLQQIKSKWLDPDVSINEIQAY